MARAKSTERAEARRRYRAATAPDETGHVTEAGATPPSAGRTASSIGRSSSSASSGTKSTAPVGRVGFVDAFKLSIRPIHVRPDLEALPWIAIHTKALWLPLLVTIGATIFIIATNGTDGISQFLFAYFVQTPAIGGVFIAGFLAPRASWLLGAIVGFASAACYAVLVISYPTAIYAAALPSAEQARDIAISAFFLSPVIGGFFAAGAAWYRRFLALSSPNRARKQATAQKKQGDGKTRGGSTSQKANVKR